MRLSGCACGSAALAPRAGCPRAVEVVQLDRRDGLAAVHLGELASEYMQAPRRRRRVVLPGTAGDHPLSELGPQHSVDHAGGTGDLQADERDPPGCRAARCDGADRERDRVAVPLRYCFSSKAAAGPATDSVLLSRERASGAARGAVYGASSLALVTVVSAETPPFMGLRNSASGSPASCQLVEGRASKVLFASR
jgi:hypothetical protein